jgi:DNA-binding transcriptional regulator/RsmH inhibitor MraZ
LNGWATARDAAQELGLNPTTEKRLANAVAGLTVLLEIDRDGRVQVAREQEQS